MNRRESSTVQPTVPPVPTQTFQWRFCSALLFALVATACAGTPEWPQVLTIEPDGFTYQGKRTPGSPRDLFIDSEKPGARFVIQRGEDTTTRHFADTLGFKVLVAPDARDALSLGLMDTEGQDVLIPTVEPIWILLEGSEIRVAGFGVSTNALPSAVELGAFLDALLMDASQAQTPWIVSTSAADPEVEAAMRAVLNEKARTAPIEVPWTEPRK